VLNCRLYQLVTGHVLPHWQEGVEAFFAHRNAALAESSTREAGK
jgi:hypothetical protein